MTDPAAPNLRDRAARLRALAGQGVWIGTSSWKYPGWVGDLYDDQRYLVRGRFSTARFERHCLEEYATVLPTVCVDAGFYRLPTRQWIDGLCGQVPGGFRFSFKVTDEITMKRFPALPRHGDRGGKPNPHFLDADLFAEAFLGPLAAHRAKTGLLIFEFTRLRSGDFARGRDFLAALDAFLGRLPGGWDYGVELRNPGLLRDEYFDLLRAHGVGHVYNHWQRMPGAGAQWAAHPPDLGRAPAGARFLLKPGRAYREAVAAFAPYDRVQDKQPAARAAAARMVTDALAQAAARQARPLYAYVNNRLEGNALATIAAVLDQVDAA